MFEQLNKLRNHHEYLRSQNYSSKESSDDKKVFTKARQMIPYGIYIDILSQYH